MYTNNNWTPTRLAHTSYRWSYDPLGNWGYNRTHGGYFTRFVPGRGPLRMIWSKFSFYVVLLMVQKSQATTWDVWKTLQIMGFQLTFSQLVQLPEFFSTITSIILKGNIPTKLPRDTRCIWGWLSRDPRVFPPFSLWVNNSHPGVIPVLVHSYLSGELGQQNLTFFLESWQFRFWFTLPETNSKGPWKLGPPQKGDSYGYVSFREGTDRFYFFEHQKSQNCTSRI